MESPQDTLARNGERDTEDNRRRVARLIYFWNRKQDAIEPIKYWPRCLQARALRLHKKHMDRFILTKFFLGNGVHPDMVGELVLCGGSTYDRGARHHISQIVKNRVQMLRCGRYQYYDLNTRKMEMW